MMNRDRSGHRFRQQSQQITTFGSFFVASVQATHRSWRLCPDTPSLHPLVDTLRQAFAQNPCLNNREVVMTANIWIIVANSSEARLFEQSTPSSELEQRMQWRHPASRGHEALARHQHRSSGIQSRAGLMPRETSRDHERHAFAHEISTWLKQETALTPPSRLIVFASPGFLGHLHQAFAHSLIPCAYSSHPLDLTRFSAREIMQRLPVHGSL